MSPSALENLRLIEAIEANRAFILQAYFENPELLARAESRIRALLAPLPTPTNPADGAEYDAGHRDDELHP